MREEGRKREREREREGEKIFFFRPERVDWRGAVATIRGALLHYFVTSRKRVSVEWEGNEGLK